jgi:hypothetical protein
VTVRDSINVPFPIALLIFSVPATSMEALVVRLYATVTAVDASMLYYAQESAT